MTTQPSPRRARGISRRGLVAMVPATLAVSGLAACGSGHHHGTEDRPGPAPAGAVRAPGASTVMIVRHAEKPEGSAGGVDADGAADPEGLTTRGWSRAGALVGLFAPLTGAPRGGLVRPTALLASDPGSGGSRRPQQTLTEVAAAVGVPISATIDKKDHAGAAAALAANRGPVLVAWEHEDIPGIVGALGTVTPTPPVSWPDARFDVVWILTPAAGGWSFAQVPQLLLAGDLPDPIR